MFDFFQPSFTAGKERGITGVPLPSPISTKRAHELMSAWSRAVRYRESGCIYYYSKADLLKRFRQIMCETQLFSQYFGTKKIIIIDAESYLYEDKQDWEQIFQDTIDATDAYFIVGVDTIIFGDNRAILSVLEHMSGRFPSKSFLLFFTKDFNQTPYKEIIEDKNFLKQIEIYHPLPSRKDSLQFIKYLQKKWDITLGKSDIEHITEPCGNHYYFIKEAVRYIRDNPQKKAAAFTHELMQKKVEQIWNTFSATEQTVYMKIIHGRYDFTHEEKQSFEFLIKTGWLTPVKNNYKIVCSLIENFCSRLHKKNKLSINFDGYISVNGIPLKLEFSKQEQGVIKKLLHAGSTIVSRETVALTLWGIDWHDHYSDWAIDRLMFRLRTKLRELGVKNTIKTIKGKGYVMS